MLFRYMRSVPLLIKFFALAFSALLPLINPLGSALLLLGFVGNARESVFRDLARRIAVRTTLFLLVVELVGSGLLEFFGISLPVVQVAGGLVLASMGWSLLNQQETESNPKQAEVERAGFGPVEDKVFYPLTFPLTVGPGCIVVMLTLSAHASAARGVLEDVMAHVGISLAVVFLSLIVYLSYRYAPKITERISAQTAHGILRIVAFVLLCIGVQITWNGVEALLKTVMKG
ncbi:Multiple antibiotic resistance (MarC)-related protein [Candidatus Sulfotelmatobacter sp. SbA7]|jgi:multiple antibiotic resistance protein|nr:Multiple antibiotic resistance (MarC)-related protein [Candidatus Sulfotelmatobacter sp. SbA7]